MAANSRRDAGLLLLIVVFCSSYGYSIAELAMPNMNHVTTWALRLSTRIRQNVSSFSGLSVIKRSYNNKGWKYYSSPQVELEFEEVNATVLNEEMAANLGTVLARKMQALNDSVRVAETAARHHEWKPKIKKEDVEYLSSKELDESMLEYNERFKQKILANVSSVHIPVEIYDGDVEILNGLKWSAALDEVFAENFKKDPEILWQYFGSQTGFMRTLPASKWRTGPQDVDLYDVRRRPWYTQGSSSPKDMLILIDTSGSVTGQALELIRVSVRSLLDTLGENDFVNIAKFDQKVQFVSCFNDTLVQANYRNKKILIDAVDKIEAHGMADFGVGITFAFEQFLKLDNESRPNRGANCNRMIMLLTDGGTDLAEEVFKKYNPEKNQTVRVFTYAVGPTANPVASIRWMACANRGFFSQIPAMGAIRSKVQEYVEVVARPLALNNEHHTEWTSVSPDPNAEYVPVISRPSAIAYVKQYKWDSIYIDKMGLGMMTTVTLPVYNKTEGSSNQTILGVMGIDVTTKEMLKYEPKRKLGANGYAYAINSNGYIVFHPNLRVQKELTDPPNVDFLEVEFENGDKEKIRRQMIDQVEDTVTVDTYMIATDKRHVNHENRTYAYRKIPDTTFSLGISLPSYQKYYMKVKTDISHFNLTQLLEPENTVLLIANWDYYKNFSSEANLTGTIEDLADALLNYQKYEWNDEEIHHLLWDLNVTHHLDTYLPLVAKEKDGVLRSFVATNGGLTRVYPKSSQDMVMKFHSERDAWYSDYFQRAIGSPLFLFSAPYILTPDSGPNATAPDITIVKSIPVHDTYIPNAPTSLQYEAAVVGTVLTHNTIRDWLMAGQTVKGFKGCSHSEELACYLLDDGGFLIATNQNISTSVGMFFGHIDKEVMWELYNKTNTYNRLENYDYQATCKISEDGTTSAGTLSFRIPSINLLYEALTFNWWSAAFTTLMNLNLYNLLFNPSVQQATASVEGEAYRPCIKNEAQYFFESSFEKLENETDCMPKECSRKYKADRVDGTNLLLLVTEILKPECQKCADYLTSDDLIQEPTEKGDQPDFCNVEPRYRQTRDKCYDKDPREDVTKCGCLSCHSASFLLISLVALFTTYQWSLAS